MYTQLVDKFAELYNGAVINTGENRLVLHQLTRGQLGNDVIAEGVTQTYSATIFRYLNSNLLINRILNIK